MEARELNVISGPQALPTVDEPCERADAARNRRRILAAAAQLIEERGVEHVSMDAIAAGAGVGKGTLFRRFGDRSGLVMALLDERTREFQDALIRGAAPLGPGAPPVDRVVAFGRGMLGLLEQHGEMLMAAELGARWVRGEGGVYAPYRAHLAVLDPGPARELGNSPWTVLAEGVSKHTPLSIGAATFAISVVVLLCWIPLREWPGLGTVLNAIVIGVAIDTTLALLPHLDSHGVRWAALLGGIAVVGLGSGLYLTAALGPGPRDGLMTGLHMRFGWPLAAVRTAIELSAASVGLALGGRVGAGTLAFALLIGPAVATAVHVIAP